MRHPSSVWLQPLALVALVALAGCDTGTDPGESQLGDFEPDVVQNGVESVLVPVQASGEANQNLIIALRDLEDDGVVVLDNGPAPALSRIDDARSLARVPGVQPIVQFPDSLLGKTIVYFRALDRWAVDPDLTDAPADGFRIVYYAVDALGAIALPIVERGYIDLYQVDAEGLSGLRTVAYNTQGASPQLVMEVVQAYTKTGTAADTTEHLEANGHFSDGQVQVGFTLDSDVLTSVATGNRSYTFTMEFDRGGSLYTFDWSGTFDAGTKVYNDDFQIAFSGTGGTTVLHLTSESDASPFTGSGPGILSNDGTTIAQVELDQGTFRFTHPEGAKFSGRDQDQLESLTSTLWIGGFYILASLPLTIYI